MKGVQEYAIFCLTRWVRGQLECWRRAHEGYRAGNHRTNFSVLYPREDVKSGKPEQGLAEAAQHGQSEHEGWRNPPKTAPVSGQTS